MELPKPIAQSMTGYTINLSIPPGPSPRKFPSPRNLPDTNKKRLVRVKIPSAIERYRLGALSILYDASAESPPKRKAMSDTIQCNIRFVSEKIPTPIAPIPAKKRRVESSLVR